MSQKRNRFQALLHHALVALSVASVVHVLEDYHALNWLDSLMLRVASRAGAESSGVTLSADMPIVLQIGDTLFEREFGQASTLNRRKLMELIKHIADKGPRSLAIDIDLSPGPGADCPPGEHPAARSAASAGSPATSDSPCSPDQIALNRLLIELGRKPQFHLILATPLPVATAELWREKSKWMAALCGNSSHAKAVEFAFVHTPLSQQDALRFDAHLPSLGVLTAVVEGRLHLARKRPCEFVQANPDSAVFLLRQSALESMVDMADFRGQRPFSVHFFDYQTKATDTLQSFSDVDEIDKKLPFKDRTVFLGGGYGDRDAYPTAFGQQNGVSLHAAAYYSVLRGVNRIRDWGAFVIDILIGIAAGFLFHQTWDRYNHAALGVAQGNANRSIWRAYFRARAWLAGNFLLVAALVIMLAYLSGWLLRSDLWVNPGPVIIGVFIKTILASRSTLGRGEYDLAAPHASHNNLVTQRADFILLLPFVVWATWLLIRGH
jgi:CHASE2 domain-containing sensor protein